MSVEPVAMVLPQPRGRAGGAYALPCQAPGCDGRTAESKPYCEEHVLWHPYARRVREGLEALERSDPDAVEREALRGLVEGPQTSARLAITVGCGAHPFAVTAALGRLEARGLVKPAKRRGRAEVTWVLRRLGNTGIQEDIVRSRRTS